MVLTIIDRSQAAEAPSVAFAIDSICVEAFAPDDTSVMTERSGIIPSQSPPSDR